MDAKSVALTWIIYAVIEYVLIVVFVLIIVHLIRKGKFKQWSLKRKNNKMKKHEDNKS